MVFFLFLIFLLIEDPDISKTQGILEQGVQQVQKQAILGPQKT